MWSAKSEIERSAEDQNICIEIIDEQNTRALYNRIMEIYSCGLVRAFLWDSLDSYVYLHDSQGWQIVGEYVSDKSCILFCEPEECRNGYRVSNAKDLISIIGDCFAFDFYVTDDNYDYLLCFNHHDTLIACGSAKKWLAEKAESQ